MEINGAERKATQAEMLANSPSSTYSDLLGDATRPLTRCQLESRGPSRLPRGFVSTALSRMRFVDCAVRFRSEYRHELGSHFHLYWPFLDRRSCSGRLG